jgi:lipid A 3-O-deacylase
MGRLAMREIVLGAAGTPRQTWVQAGVGRDIATLARTGRPRHTRASMRTRFPRPLVAAAGLVLSVLAVPAHAGLETSYDNDTNAMVPGAATTDRNYTMGAHATWWGRPGELPRWARGVARHVHLEDGRATPRLSYQAGQELYTPDALSNPRPIVGDRPYAAWLYGGVLLSAADARHARALDARLGVIGPLAQGEEVQAWWHRREGIRAPRGWPNQLANEPGLRVSLDERWRPWGPRRFADVIPHVRLTAGNVLTEAAAGATVRVGPRLANDFGPGAPSGPEAAARGFRLQGFARAEGRAVARDVFLDGSTFTHSLRVHHEPFVGEAQMGVELRLGAIGARYQFSYTTRQFRERPYSHEYGSIAFRF